MESSQPARCTYNLQPDLLGSFRPADVCPDITGQFGCGHTEKFSPSVGVGEGGSIGNWVWPKCEIHPYSEWGGGLKGKEASYKQQIAAIPDTRSPHHHQVELAQTATLSFQKSALQYSVCLLKDILLFPNLPACKNLSEEQIFWGTDPWVPLQSLLISSIVHDWLDKNKLFQVG